MINRRNYNKIFTAMIVLIFLGTAIIPNISGNNISDNKNSLNAESQIKPTQINNKSDYGTKYLIITHPNFTEAIQPLANWHHKKGLKTEVISIETDNASIIKEIISLYYDTEPIEYVLLVGDIEFIPVFYWNKNILSDYWYSCITIDPNGEPDVYGDVAIGRLSVNDSETLEKIVHKTLMYEKNPILSNITLNALFVAHYGYTIPSQPGKFQATKTYIDNGIVKPYSNFSVIRAFGNNKTTGNNQFVKDQIKKGVGIINYQGHGQPTHWKRWTRYYQSQNFTIADIEDLQNSENKNPILLTFACLNHDIDYEDGDCLGEAFVKKFPGGAVASYGASGIVNDQANFYMDKEIFRQLCQYGNYTLGKVILNSGIKTIDNAAGENNVKSYLLLGDPALDIWTEKPKHFSISKPEIITKDPHELQIKVEDLGQPVENVTVCLFKVNDIHEVGTTDQNGIVTFSVDPLTVGDLHVTVSKHNFVPVEDVIKVKSSSETAYLIITHPDFENEIKSLAEHRTKQGIKTEIITKETTDPLEIKDIINNSYNNGSLDFVLLVGDVEFMPIYNWHNVISDYWYGCITEKPNGDLDYFADIAVGRLSVKTQGETEIQIQKTIKYEKNPPLDGWHDKALFAAYGPYYIEPEYIGVKEHIRKIFIPQNDLIVDTAYTGEPNGTWPYIRTAIKEGRGFLNYIGHGGTQGWYMGGVDVPHVKGLHNYNYTPVVFNIACQTHKFNIGGECLGEAWLNNSHGGAVASYGSTSLENTQTANTLDKSIFEQICINSNYRIGEILNKAMSKTVDYYEFTNPAGAEGNARMHVLLGDPALKTWTDTPKPLKVVHLDQIMTGLNNLKILVKDGGKPLYGATVCLQEENEIYEIGVTNPDGSVSFTVEPNDIGKLDITVTAHNYLPYESTIEIIPQGLSCNTYELSEKGGTINFSIDAGINNGNKNYILLASATGTTPGLVLPNGYAVLPINRDDLTNMILSRQYTHVFTDFIGTLDGNGQATATLNLHKPLLPGYIGTKTYFAYALFNPCTFVSNPVEIEIVE